MYRELKQAAKHYEGEQGYCSVIAVAVAAGCKFGKARAAMARAGRKHGKGATIGSINAALNEFGLDAKQDIQLTLHASTLKTVTRTLPRSGTYLVYTSGHVSCVKDGVLEDWAAETGSRKRIKVIYRVSSI